MGVLLLFLEFLVQSDFALMNFMYTINVNYAHEKTQFFYEWLFCSMVF